MDHFVQVNKSNKNYHLKDPIFDFKPLETEI